MSLVMAVGGLPGSYRILLWTSSNSNRFCTVPGTVCKKSAVAVNQFTADDWFRVGDRCRVYSASIMIYRTGSSLRFRASTPLCFLWSAKSTGAGEPWDNQYGCYGTATRSSQRPGPVPSFTFVRRVHVKTSAKKSDRSKFGYTRDFW